MDKEQKALLVQAWELHTKILKDIGILATMNQSLAYGCIRSAETLIETLMVDNMLKLRIAKKEVTDG